MIADDCDVAKATAKLASRVVRIVQANKARAAVDRIGLTSQALDSGIARADHVNTAIAALLTAPISRMPSGIGPTEQKCLSIAQVKDKKPAAPSISSSIRSAIMT
jgi:hypothetical protein